MIEEIRRIVQKECDPWNWHYHMIPVIQYAKFLAQKTGVDVELAELAALLHDIGRIRFGSPDHEKTGVKEADIILRKYSYSDLVINEVKHCIESHRCIGNQKPKTQLARIIASADALSHFDIIPGMIQAGLRRNGDDIEKAVSWVESKMERDFNEKLLCELAKQIAAPKYSAYRLIIDSMRPYFYTIDETALKN